MKRRLDAITWGPPVLLFAVAVGFTALTGQFSPAARAVPRLVGLVVLLLCALDLLSRLDAPIGRALAGWLNPAGLTEPHQGVDRALMARQMAATGATIGFVAAFVLLGVLPAVALFGVLALRFGGRLGWRTGLATSAAMTGLVWLLFGRVLGLALFPGLLFGGVW